MSRSPEIVQWCAQQFAASLAAVLEAMAGERPETSTKAGRRNEVVGSRAAEPDRSLWWEQGFSVAPEPAVWIGAPQETWEDLGGRVLGAAGVEAFAPEEARSTYCEVLKQALAGVAQALSQKLQTEVTCQEGKELPSPPAVSQWHSLTVRFGETELPPLTLVWHAGFIRAIENGGVGAPAPDAAKAAAEASQPRNSKTLDLLLDVELPVSISFGRAELPVKEVLKLTTGSIVELNRGVNEPVEVIVNNCVIARGEVVVMEGNYGVRIQQIISRQERLRTLK